LPNSGFNANNNSTKHPISLADTIHNNEKKTDLISLLAFSSSLFPYLLIPLLFIPIANILGNILTFSILAFLLIGIILGFIGLHRIKKHPDKLKGKVFGILAIILGFLLPIAIILSLIILLLTVGP